MSENNRKSFRLPRYDYASPGAYFITVCTQKREHVFGDIFNNMMCQNSAGTMIQTWWYKLPSKYPSIQLDEFCIMPNHVHGIVMIHDHKMGRTHGSAPTEKPSIPTIVQWFKTMTTNEYIRNVESKQWPSFPNRLWQRNYYEHIIRTEQSLHAIRMYIRYNIKNWQHDDLLSS